MKELEDQAWFPSGLRNFQVGFIGFITARFGIYHRFAAKLSLHPFENSSMTDLCSGSGEPALYVFKKVGRFRQLELSDKFPQPFHCSVPAVRYRSSGTDVLDLEFHSGTCYTMFNAFHHFSDSEKQHIVEKVRQSGSEAFFVEILEPGTICLLKVMGVATLGNLLLAPFVRPFSLTRLFLTYVIPINVFTIVFDGVVSVLRSRTAEEYKALFGSRAEVSRISGVAPLIIIHVKPDK